MCWLSQRGISEGNRLREPMPCHEDAGMEGVQLLKIEVAALKRENEIGLAKATLQALYAEDPAFARF